LSCHDVEVTGTHVHGLRGAPPLLLVSAVVVLVTFGFARGFSLSNLHNGLLAMAFAGVGAYVLLQRPGHREGVLFMATGVVEAVTFFGRQVGQSPSLDASRWWGWLGVWPVVVALALTTLSVLCFPDGRLPSPRWRWVAAAVIAIAAVCATLSAIWPVEYESAGLSTVHPVNAEAPSVVSTVWSAIAHPAYIVFQVLWVVAVVARWRSSAGHARRQQAARPPRSSSALRGGERPGQGSSPRLSYRSQRAGPSSTANTSPHTRPSPGCPAAKLHQQACPASSPRQWHRR
jgi:branched-subunit amino acid transport protein